MMQVHLLVKGDYIIFGGKSDFFAGTTLKDKVDKLIAADSGTLLKQAVTNESDNVWFTRHQTPGTMMVIQNKK